MSIEVRDNKGKWLDLVHKLRELESLELHVGIVGDGAEKEHDEKSGATVADIAAFHEFGLGVPQRSFLRGWVDEQSDDIYKTMRSVGKLMIAGKVDSQQALDQAGARFVGLIQKRIADRIEPELSEKTVMRKGSDVPLIDTGVLRSSITWMTVDVGH